MNNDTFTNSFLLKAFLSTHSDPVKPVYQGKNSEGYHVHFTNEIWQRLWEEWQTCAAAMLLLVTDSVEHHEAVSKQ